MLEWLILLQGSVIKLTILLERPPIITPTTYLNRESLIRSPDTLNLHVLYCLTVAESLGLEMIFFYLRTEEEYYYSLLRTDADVVQFL